MAIQRRQLKSSPLRTAIVVGLVLFSALATALAVYFLFVPLARENISLLNKEATLKKHNAELEQDNARLQEELRQLGSNPVYVEKVARDELGLGKPGELVYRFKGKEEK